MPRPHIPYFDNQNDSYGRDNQRSFNLPNRKTARPSAAAVAAAAGTGTAGTTGGGAVLGVETSVRALDTTRMTILNNDPANAATASAGIGVGVAHITEYTGPRNTARNRTDWPTSESGGGSSSSNPGAGAGAAVQPTPRPATRASLFAATAVDIDIGTAYTTAAAAAAAAAAVGAHQPPAEQRRRSTRSSSGESVCSGGGGRGSSSSVAAGTAAAVRRGAGRFASVARTVMLVSRLNPLPSCEAEAVEIYNLIVAARPGWQQKVVAKLGSAKNATKAVLGYRHPTYRSTILMETAKHPGAAKVLAAVIALGTPVNAANVFGESALHCAAAGTAIMDTEKVRYAKYNR